MFENSRAVRFRPTRVLEDATMIKKITAAIYWILIAVLIVIVGSMTLSALDTPLGFKLYVVQSGSMQPTIKTGSIVAVAKENSYQVGDIVTYQPEGQGQTTVTHRIASVKKDDGVVLYSTKGDANNSPDLKPVTDKQVLGKVRYWIPYMGYAIGFAKTQIGFIFLIVVPVTIIIYSELINIKNEAKKLIRTKKLRNLTLKEQIEEKIGEEIIEVEKKVKKVAKKI